MKMNYRKLNITTLLIVLTVSFSGCGTKTQDVPQETPKTSVASRDYVKPEGWRTLESVEYGFKVDYPNGWRINPGGKHIGTNTKSQIDLTSPNGNRVIFNIYHTDTTNGLPYKAIPFEDRFPELTDNQEMIDKYGEAFRYFRGVYSLDMEDDFVRKLRPRTEWTEEDFYKENHIYIYMKKPAYQKEDLATIKTILKSFRRH
jgi:hypothetical protein